MHWKQQRAYPWHGSPIAKSPTAFIAPGSTVDYEPRVRRTSFGDGYSQRTGDGLNVLSRKLSASFQVLSDSEANTLLGFFEGRKGYLPFMWTFPRARGLRPLGKRPTPVSVTDISVTLEETFDL
jgi:phage-related protein